MAKRLSFIPGFDIPACLRQFRQERSGSSAVLVGLLGAVLFGFTAVGVDGASFFLAKRRQQAATDLAAIAAAGALAQAPARLATVMAANGYPAAALESAIGTYTPDATLAPAQRFTLSATGNAVRVAATTTQPFIFGGAFQALLGGGRSSPSSTAGVPIRTEAIARKLDTTAFTLGTGVASLDGGLLNAVLGGLLGTQISLSVLDYQALASANVDLFDFGSALATRIRAPGPTYGTLTASAAPPAALFSSLADALGSSTGAAAAARSIAAALPPSAAVPLGPLIDYGPAASLVLGAPHPMAARVTALDVLTALVRLCNGGHIATIGLGASLPGLMSVQLSLVVGEPVQGSGYFAVGPEGTVLHSAQLRLQITTQITGAGLPASLTLPLYLELAPATAAVTDIACGAGAAQAVVTLNVASGLAAAAIGTVRATSMADLSASPSVDAATLLDLAGLLRVSATAQATLAASGPTAVRFTADDIRSGVAKSVTAPLSLAALLDGLAANTRVSVSLLGLTPPQPALPGAVQAAIATAIRPLDLAIERLLPLLGLSVGIASTSVTGVRCSQGQLVN